MSALATLLVRERAGIARAGEAIRIGAPLSRGALSDPAACSLCDADGRTVPAQFKSLATWPDGSIRWLLVDACVDMAAGGDAPFTVRATPAHSTDGGLDVQVLQDRIRIDTQRAVFDVPINDSRTIAAVNIGGSVLDADGIHLSARGGAGNQLEVRLRGARVEESGPVRVCVIRSGSLEQRGAEVARITLRLVFQPQSAAARIECEVWNPRAARHVGGLWDLGDAGSIALRDLSIELRPAQSPASLEWQALPGPWTSAASNAWLLHQDSSGGDRWNSPNHVDARGKPTVTFRGYRVQGQGVLLAEGTRATPAVRVAGERGRITASVEKFWQNFPKALRFRDGTLGIGLFPAESAVAVELQGGEKKRHVAFVEFSGDSASTAAAWHAPLEVSLAPAEAAATGAVGYLLPAARDRNAGYLEYVASLLDGPNAVVAKREIIDEFGWRNFGDLYADHEAVHHQGRDPFVSHYNNQYDFVYGAAMHFLRTGEQRWRELMVDAARHHIDIDVYHTSEDKAGFNGGLFWHTDHYQPAATCTHRTYSRKNAIGPYGGGPSNEHNYTSGLLHYFYITGDPEAAAVIREMADWVIAMDDGSRTLPGLLDDGPTGRASQTRDMDFQKPGRGAGNSINALLDAYAVSRERHYLAFAETLIQRVIHPADDVAALKLDQPENRWSYLVFLQVLGKYLDRKLEWGETDYLFWYARASLLTYTHWMLDHEQPYRDVLHKVELPTETWPAHDVRKAHVFHLAARFAPEAERAVFTAKAGFYFDRCLADLLSFPTAYLTRPQVILCGYGVVHGYYQDDPHYAMLPSEPLHAFGKPVPFEPQHARLRGALRRKVSIMTNELGRLLRDRLRVVLARIRP